MSVAARALGLSFVWTRIVVGDVEFLVPVVKLDAILVSGSTRLPRYDTHVASVAHKVAEKILQCIYMKVKSESITRVTRVLAERGQGHFFVFTFSFCSSGPRPQHAQSTSSQLGP